MWGSAMKVPSGTWAALALGSAFLIGSLLWLLISPSVPAGLFAAFSAVVLVGAFVDHLRRLAARVRIAAPEMTVPDRPLRAGEEFALGYRQSWKRAADVSRVRSELVLRETVQYTTQTTGEHPRTETVTKTHDQVAQGFVVVGQHFEPGQTINEYRKFRIPDDAMHTFTSSNNRIGWYLVVVVEIDRWPDYRWEHELPVSPELAG
jgi:hypothetical protein